VPAIIVNVTPESRASLSKAVSEALNGAPVKLAADALTKTDVLIIEREQARDPNGQMLNGREREMPEHFQLVKSADQCVLVHRLSDQRVDVVFADELLRILHRACRVASILELKVLDRCIADPGRQQGRRVLLRDADRGGRSGGRNHEADFHLPLSRERHQANKRDGELLPHHALRIPRRNAKPKDKGLQLSLRRGLGALAARRWSGVE